VTSTQHYMHRIAREGAIGLAGAAVSAVSTFLLVVIVTNLFSQEVAGRFFTVMSAFLVVLPVATLGTDVGLGRFLLRFVAQGRTQDIPPVIRAAFLPVLGSTLLLSLATIVLAPEIADLVGVPGEATALRILAVALPAAVVAELSLAGTRAFGRMRATVLVDRFLRSVVQVLLVVAVSLTAGGLWLLTSAWAVPYLVTAVLAALVFRGFVRARMAERSSASDVVTPYAEVRREFWSFTWPRGITGLAQIAVQRADIVLIAILLSPTQAAIYTAATRFVVLGQFGNLAIQQVVQPRFTSLLATGETSALRQVFQMSTAWSMALSWPLYVLVGTMPLVYLDLFGPQYEATGASVVVVMMVGMLIGVTSGPADTLLLMSGYSKLSMFNALVVVTVDLGLCFVLIPRMGIVGAAVAWAAAILVRWVLTVVQIRRHLHVVPWCRAMLVVVSAVLACLMLPLGVISLLGGQSLVVGVLVGGLGLAAYAWTVLRQREALMLDSIFAATRSARPLDDA
jgi:O-antigen/teichoic acid export membrane protein